MVTFSDLQNPRSAKIVDPDDLAATFGPGYRLKRLSITLTKEPLEDTIDVRIPALKKVKNMLGGMPKNTTDQAMALTPSAFRRFP
jgi:hypothetical protein